MLDQRQNSTSTIRDNNTLLELDLLHEEAF
jgi:hypothetical protein